MGAVYRLAYHLARNPHEADDIAQETYLRAFRSEATYRPTAHGMRPWLFKILHNVLNSRISKARREREVVESLDAPAETERDLPEPSGAIDWENIDERLMAAIRDLSVPHRSVFLLCAVEGLGYREIADVQEIPVGTVMSRLYRARMILSARLAGLAAEQGLRSGQGLPINEMEKPS